MADWTTASSINQQFSIHVLVILQADIAMFVESGLAIMRRVRTPLSGNLSQNLLVCNRFAATVTIILILQFGVQSSYFLCMTKLHYILNSIT